MSSIKLLWTSNEELPPEQIEGLDGISLTIATTGQECCQAARASSYSAIVADFPLPDCSPDELLEEIKRIDPFLPVVIRDRVGTFSDAVRLTKAGAEDFFGADFDVDRLTKIVEASRESQTARDLVAPPFRGNNSPLPPWRKSVIGSSRPMEHGYFALSSWWGRAAARC